MNRAFSARLYGFHSPKALPQADNEEAPLALNSPEALPQARSGAASLALNRYSAFGANLEKNLLSPGMQCRF
jgi:hypothetical protein